MLVRIYILKPVPGPHEPSKRDYHLDFDSIHKQQKATYIANHQVQRHDNTAA